MTIQSCSSDHVNSLTSITNPTLRRGMPSAFDKQLRLRIQPRSAIALGGWWCFEYSKRVREMRIKQGNAAAMCFALRLLSLFGLVNVFQVYWFINRDFLEKHYLSPASLEKTRLASNILRLASNILFSENMTHFYCKRRYDRSGAAIQDYLMAHAFAFHFGRQFAGACGSNSYPHNHQAQMNIIELLGLEKELLILDECPTANDTSALVLDRYIYYMWKDTDIWTPEWIEYIQQRGRLDRQQELREPTVVVHMRRGDVQPCDNYTYNRYLPNSHYIALIHQYRTSNHSKVIVHSESQSQVEPWMDFDDIDGIAFKMDTDPIETWRDIFDADVFIMSLSSFSLVAALFSKASRVIYSPFWHRPQPQWVRVSDMLMMQSESQKALLREKKCSTTINTINRPP